MLSDQWLIKDRLCIICSSIVFKGTNFNLRNCNEVAHPFMQIFFPRGEGLFGRVKFNGGRWGYWRWSQLCKLSLWPKPPSGGKDGSMQGSYYSACIGNVMRWSLIAVPGWKQEPASARQERGEDYIGDEGTKKDSKESFSYVFPF